MSIHLIISDNIFVFCVNKQEGMNIQYPKYIHVEHCAMSIFFLYPFWPLPRIRSEDFWMKTRPWIDLILLGFWRFWCRWKAGDLSIPTTLKSSSVDQYWCILWSCFDFWSFWHFYTKKGWDHQYACKNDDFWAKKNHRKWSKIKTLSWNASILVGW